MGKKKSKQSSKPPQRVKPSIDFEQSPYYVPVVFAIYFLALVFLFRDFLFSNLMLYGSDMIQAGIFFRSLLVDHVYQHGAVPQWNPYIFGGMPYVEAFHGDIFYPLSILKFFGSIYRKIGLTLFFHIYLAGIFMYLAARQYKLPKTASLFSAACYMFAAYLVSLISPGHDGKIFVTTLFPLVMLFLDRMFERQPFLNASILGLVIGVIILSPHPQMSYFTLWTISFYSAYRLILLWIDKKSVSIVIKPAALVAYAVVIGLMISAIQFYPGYIYTSKFSPRADSKSGWDWATSWSMHEEEAMSLLVPEFCGVSSRESSTMYWGKNYFKDNSESVGVVTIFVALLGLFFARRRDKYFFGGLAVFALLYALGATTPVFHIFYALIPKVKSLRAPSMIMFLFSFSAALLAGMGIQYLMNSQKSREELKKKLKFEYILFGFPGFLLLLAFLFGVAGKGMLRLWSSLFYPEASTTMVQQGVSKLDVAFYSLPGIQAGFWLAFLFTALAAVCIWLYRGGKMGTGILVALLFIPVVDGVRFDKRFIKTFDQNKVWADTPLSNFFTQKKDYFRVADLQSPQSDILPFHKIPVIVGYHGNQLRWYDELLGGPNLKNLMNPRFVNLTGTKYIIMSPNQKLPPDHLGPKPTPKVADFGSSVVYENKNAFPRVYLVERYKVFEDHKAIYPAVLKGTDDLRKIVYLEEKPELEITPDSLNTDSAWISKYAEDTVIVGLNCSRNELLVLTDNYYDAWHVTLDGHPAKLLRAYGSFRAVAVPAGTKEVSFIYKSKRYRVGKLVTWLTSLYLLVIFALYIVQTQRRRKKKKEVPIK